MASVQTHLSSVSPRDRDQLESWLVDFERSWNAERLAQQAQSLSPENPLRIPALVEMIKIDLERHWRAGRRVRLDDYLALYPEIGTADTVPAELIWAEYEVRCQFRDAVDLSEYRQRFPRQAEALHQLAHESTVEPADRSSLPAPAAGASAGSLPESFGRYRILKCLGRGGMGAVYLAHDTQLDRQVALKVPNLLPTDDPALLERFYREARAAAVLDHPHLCRIHDVGQIENTPYLTMSYVDGPSLAEHMKDRAPLAPARAANLVRTVALAMAEAHAQGVIHRDLKPSNILLKGQDEPVVTDFGLARRVQREDVRLTRSGSLIGSPGYMSPEQVAGAANLAGPATDIYSLGVVLYELLTGRLPFTGSMGEMFAQILHDSPERPTNIRADLDPRLEAICLRALAKKPEERFPSMAEFAAALADWQRPEMGGEQHHKSRRRAVLVIVVALFLIGLGILSVVRPWITGTRGGGGGGGPNGGGEVNGGGIRPPREGLGPGDDPGKSRAGSPNFVQGTDLDGHRGEVKCVAFLGDDRHAVSGGTDKTLRHWDLASGKQTGEATFHKLHNWVFVAPDGARYLVGGGLNVSKLLDTRTDKELQQFTTGPHAFTAAFSRDGQRVAIGYQQVLGKHMVTIWDAQSGATKSDCAHDDAVRCVALSPNGHLALSATDKTTRVWDGLSGVKLHDLERVGVTCAAFSPTGAQLVIGQTSGVVELWDVAAKRFSRRFDQPHSGPVSCVAFSPDERQVISGGADRILRLRDLPSGKTIQQLDGHADELTCVAFSENGRRILSGDKGNAVRVWEVAK